MEERYTQCSIPTLSHAAVLPLFNSQSVSNWQTPIPNHKQRTEAIGNYQTGGTGEQTGGTGEQTGGTGEQTGGTGEQSGGTGEQTMNMAELAGVWVNWLGGGGG